MERSEILALMGELKLFGMRAAFDEIIHVSDQPVAPSVGTVVSTLTPSAASRFAITCHEVPITESPDVNAACSFV